MMRTQIYNRAIVVLLMASSCSPANSAQTRGDGGYAATAVRLCDGLTTIEAGEARRVTISGIYVVGAEHRYLYDPKEPRCRADVQPETWVEFALGVVSDDLTRLMKNRRPFQETRRAYVTFTGELYGPGAVGLDDISIPQFAAFANRTAKRRYGHLNGYRTKLVVREIRDVKSVPRSVAWPSGRSAREVLYVESAKVPMYPEMALNVGISGDVVLEATVSGGQISKVEVKSGDRMLAGEAVGNVKTWQFGGDSNATFITTFSFILETRNTGASTATRIELDLPERVHITAARNGW